MSEYSDWLSDYNRKLEAAAASHKLTLKDQRERDENSSLLVAVLLVLLSLALTWVFVEHLEIEQLHKMVTGGVQAR